ncbi:hypothetical protein EDC96DRAFT_521541 [Choanephora cucurbitarum]|nr:hypothetical protein EDC96DRAFT_521541 [Choanephora cucurbitarum]
MSPISTVLFDPIICSFCFLFLAWIYLFIVYLSSLLMTSILINEDKTKTTFSFLFSCMNLSILRFFFSSL